MIREKHIMKAPFNKLAYGTRFKFVDSDLESTFVKIGHNKVAEWRSDKIVLERGHHQSLCCFTNDSAPYDLDHEVLVID